MKIKKIISICFALFLIVLIVIYWFIPFAPMDLNFSSNTNFSIGNENSSNNMQFYPNMRFAYSSISYTIEEDCSIQKISDMKRAFEIIEEETLLDFYALEENGQITVSCQDRNVFKEKGLFIAKFSTI